MPRKSPARIRTAAARSPWPADATGALPGSVRYALARLERLDLDPVEVAWAVTDWRRIDRLLSRRPAPRHSDDVEYVASQARDLLEVALCALHGRARRQLAHVVHDLDDRIQSRTIEDPQGSAGPWWRRILVTE